MKNHRPTEARTPEEEVAFQAQKAENTRRAKQEQAIINAATLTYREYVDAGWMMLDSVPQIARIPNIPDSLGGGRHRKEEET